MRGRGSRRRSASPAVDELADGVGVLGEMRGYDVGPDGVDLGVEPAEHCVSDC